MKKYPTLAAIVLIVTILATPAQALAASGLPDSAEFGYGARLDLSGEQPFMAMAAAAGLGLDWIAIDFDWAAIWPDSNTSPNLGGILETLETARQNHLQVLISLTHAPAWGLTPNGPDPIVTANLVASLAGLYPDTLIAVELFPQANTAIGWGAKPDPQAYLSLAQTVHSTLRSRNSKLTLVFGGLTCNQQPGDINDLEFLRGLYQAGAVSFMQVVSIQMPDLSGDPVSSPTANNQNVLRHYEEVRKIMLQNNHRAGLIWITSFSWPAETIDPEQQGLWVSEAYQLMLAQLYLGVAFFDQLNPPHSGSNGRVAHLLNTDLSEHPGIIRLNQIIEPSNDIKIRPTQSVLFKKLSHKIDFKRT